MMKRASVVMVCGSKRRRAAGCRLQWRLGVDRDCCARARARAVVDPRRHHGRSQHVHIDHHLHIGGHINRDVDQDGDAGSAGD